MAITLNDIYQHNITQQAIITCIAIGYMINTYNIIKCTLSYHTHAQHATISIISSCDVNRCVDAIINVICSLSVLLVYLPCLSRVL